MAAAPVSIGKWSYSPALPHNLPMTERYPLRQATKHDDAAIWALISQVLASYGIRADKTTTDRDLADIAGYFSGENGVFFVLLDGGTVIGTVALRRETQTCAELCRMYLAAEYRGQGLGRRLLTHATAEARNRGFQEIFPKTASVLKEAISLYTQAGFVVASGEKPCGNCDLTMRKFLR